MAASILDLLSIGVVLLDRSARVVFANSAAQALSQDGGSLLLKSRVTSPSPEEARRLGDLIRSVLDGTLVRTMSLPTRCGRPLVLLASPVRGQDGSDIFDEGATAAMLLICDPGGPAQIPSGWMMGAYGLTLAEVRVALSVASGLSISDTAQRLKVSVNTVKTHLRRVYEKTGTRRQAELSRIVATIGLVRGDQPKKVSNGNCASGSREATDHSRIPAMLISATGLMFEPAG